jgi:hypothetical protein
MRRTESQMTFANTMDERIEHPLDMVERLASVKDWTFERDEDDEICITVKGRWADYHVAFTWLNDLETLHLACAFDMKVPERRKSELLKLISTINERLWIGHFDLWSKEDVVMFRHGLVLSGGLEPNSRQCESMLQSALDACERNYQGFQFVVWAGKKANEAMDASLFETVGEA